MAVSEYFRASANNLFRAIEEWRRQITDINQDITVLRSRVTDEKNSIQREKVVRLSDLKADETNRKVVSKRLDGEIVQLNQQLQDAQKPANGQEVNAGDVKAIERQIQEKQSELENFLQQNARETANHVRELQDEQNDLKKLELDINQQINEKLHAIRDIEREIAQTERIIQSLQAKQ